VSAALERALLEQRELLRGELQAQRELIARQLGAAPGMETAFPRSHTMRLLATRPLQVARLLIGLIGLLRGR
jgi:hypothetical protein